MKKYKKVDEFKMMIKNTEGVVENLPTPEYFERIEDFYNNLNLVMATNKDRSKEIDRFVYLLIEQFRIHMKESSDIYERMERETKTYQRNVFHLQKTISHKEEGIKGRDRDRKALAREKLKLETEKEHLIKVIIKLGKSL